MLRYLKKDETGFTLVELLAVIVLSSVVVVGAMGWFRSATDIAQKQEYEIETHQLANLIIARTTETLKAGNSVTIEDNDSNAVTVKDSAGDTNVYKLKNQNCHLKITQEENKDQDLESERTNNTKLITVKLEFFNASDEKTYQRQMDVAQRDPNLIEGWW